MSQPDPVTLRESIHGRLLKLHRSSGTLGEINAFDSCHSSLTLSLLMFRILADDEHSAEFNRPIQNRMVPFYSTLIEKLIK
jgi:hypothetical protein